MVVSNELFDALLFGALLLGLGLDAAFPALCGTGFLVACGLAVYMAAQEWSEALTRRRWWTQEPLSTAVALSSGGFLYFCYRNGSDFVLLVLSIGLMMASLMLTIATLSAFAATFKQASPAPLLGYLATIGGALAMGVLGGVLTLDWPVPDNWRVATKAAVVVVSLVLWKAREALAPPQHRAGEAPSATSPATSSATSSATPAFDLRVPAPTPAVAPAALSAQGHAKWQIIPKRGTLLDRFLPVLLIGGLMFLGVQSGIFLQSVAPPASAANGNAANAPEK